VCCCHVGHRLGLKGDRRGMVPPHAAIQSVASPASGAQHDIREGSLRALVARSEHVRQDRELRVLSRLLWAVRRYPRAAPS
jgi:hypothetical protein